MKADIATYVSKCFDLTKVKGPEPSKASDCWYNPRYLNTSGTTITMDFVTKLSKDVSKSIAQFGDRDRCLSPVCLTEVGEAQILGPELIQETTEKIIQIKQRMQAARDRQKSYADLKRKSMEFQVGDKFYAKVLEKVREVAYKLELPEELSRVHNTFHVSQPIKVSSPTNLLAPSIGLLHLDDKIHFVEEPLK
ncbi:hypothetical protein Tco_0340292 [Tanacetum coccineum]